MMSLIISLIALTMSIAWGISLFVLRRRYKKLIVAKDAHIEALTKQLKKGRGGVGVMGVPKEIGDLVGKLVKDVKLPKPKKKKEDDDNFFDRMSDKDIIH